MYNKRIIIVQCDRNTQIMRTLRTRISKLVKRN